MSTFNLYLQQRILIFFLLCTFFVPTVSAQFVYNTSVIQNKADFTVKTVDAVERLSNSIKIPTVSLTDPQSNNHIHFIEFINFLEFNFPLVHLHLQRKIINQYSLLYTWHGLDTTLKPVLFMGHYDVVPADTNTLSLWQHEPFSGAIDNTHIWGRGSVDDKFQVMALLEVAEQLLKEGFTPNRSIYYAFGHDEETGGENGALEISRYLHNEKKEFEFVLDEGGGVTKGIYPGVKKEIAFIAIAEKGYMNVQLSVQAKGGHSSAPPKETAITILSKAIYSINSKPLSPKMAKPVEQMLQSLKNYGDKKTKFALNNKWLFKKAILKKISANEISNSLVSTMITPTLIKGGVKENSLPSIVTVNLNVRILPGESVETVMHHLKKTIKDDRVHMQLNGSFQNPSPVTSKNGQPYKLLKKTIESHFPEAIVAPAMSIVTTDSKHYSFLTKHILRFSPIVLLNEDKEMIHGYNERISIDNYLKAIAFYNTLIKEANNTTY
jgi:carboxypeptidase PM20D1